MIAHPADTDFISIPEVRTFLWGFSSVGPFSSAPKCPHYFGPCGRCLSGALLELQAVVGVVVVQDRWGVQQWPGWAAADVGSLADCCHSWSVRGWQDRLCLRSACWLVFVCETGSLQQQDPKAPFQASCLPAVFMDDILQPEMWIHRGGGRGLLLVQSVDEAALWRLYFFKLRSWTTEKPDLIKEHLKRDTRK